MKLTGTFYTFSAGASWLCTCSNSDAVRILTYLLTFSDYDSGRLVVNAGVRNAITTDLGIDEQRITASLKTLLSDGLLFREYGVFRQKGRDDRYVFIEGSYLIDPKYFWRGSATGKNSFDRGFRSSIHYRRGVELGGREERQWLIEPLDEKYKQQLEDNYQKKKRLEERRKQAAEKRKKTIAEKKAAKLAEQSV